MDLALKHTSLSCTQYQHGDDLGKLLAYVALAPVFVLCFQFSKVYTRRELHEGVLLLGLVFEEAIARFLKHFIKHPRPATCKMLNLCHSHGMPSSHTSMMFAYLAITSCLAIRFWRQKNAISKAFSAVEQLAIAAAAVGVAASRVYLGYHSIDQVLAGAALGSIFGLLWFAVLQSLQRLYAALAKWQLLQQLGVKDSYTVAEPLMIEQAAYSCCSSKTKTA